MLHPEAETWPGSESALFVQLVTVFSSGQKAFAGQARQASPIRTYPSLQMQRPLLSAELAGQTQAPRLDDPGGDTLDVGHAEMTPA